jgi:NAD+ synthase
MNPEQIANKLTSWIKDEVLAAGCKGAVVGMSGGLDSSVVAVLCHRAFPQNTLGVIMPCHSIDEDREHALAVAKQFSIPTKTIVLDTVFDALLKVLPDSKKNTPTSRLAKANIKTRLRMVTLYYFANQLQYLVVGSSNKNELSIGYFTKYGDGGVDIMPIGNLVKKQVKELASFLGIPQPIIDKPPSAGLWPGQTDEGEMGTTYEELDRYLLCGEANNDLKKKIETRIIGYRHKRSLPPIADL